MPKSIVIQPERVFARETIRFSEIPLNAYNQTVAQELERVLGRGSAEHLAGHVRDS